MTILAAGSIQRIMNSTTRFLRESTNNTGLEGSLGGVPDQFYKTVRKP